MEIKLRPTDQLHQITPAKEGDLCFARLWVGATENGGSVQALIFGLALSADCDIKQADVELAAVPPPKGLPEAWPPIVIAHDVPGDYTPLWKPIRAKKSQRTQ